jgi:MFS family permease
MSEATPLPDLDPDARPPHDPYAALRVSGFRWYLCGWVLSVIGQQLQSVAVGWEVFQRTGQTLWLGWVGLAQAAPLLILALPAGHLADVANRKVIVALTQLASALCAACLAVVVARHGSMALLFTFLTAGATALALGGPARSALLPRIVTSDKFANAVSWYSSLFQLSAAIGPAIGGLIILRGTWPAFALDAACSAWFGMVVTTLALLPAESGRPAASVQGLVAGIRFVWRTKIILATISLDLFAVLLGGAVFLLPAVAKVILHVGTVKFGWLRAAPAVGACLMAILVAHRPPMKHAGRAMLWAVAGFGAATIVFGLSRNYWLSVAMLFLTGAFDNISVLVRHTLVQVLTPDEMRGRVSAVNNVFIGSSNDLGGFESGVTAAWLGTFWSIVGGGIGTIVVVILTALIWPQIWRFGSLQDAKPAEFPASNG